jgi:hypothetical protein
VAVLAALAQLGVETLQGLGIEPADLQGADRGADVLVDLADVTLPGGRLQLDHFEVAVEELVDCRRAGTGAAVLVDLGEQLDPDTLGLTAGADGLAE